MAMVDPYQTLLAPIIALAGMMWPIPVFLAFTALLTLATPWLRGKLGRRGSPRGWLGSGVMPFMT
jgi:hypothetical protein